MTKLCMTNRKFKITTWILNKTRFTRVKISKICLSQDLTMNSMNYLLTCSNGAK